MSFETGPLNFKSKKIQLSFHKDIKRFWNGGSPNRTYFFHVLGVLAPGFERLFILSVLKFRKRLKGSSLEKPAKTFLAQEAQHDHQISRFINTLEKQFHYPLAALEKANLSFCKALNRRCSAELQLSMTMGAEHIIALLSEYYLKDPDWLKDADEEMAKLWTWHAVEEIEHKSVAFDVYHAVCGSYWIKAMGMLMVTGVIAGMWFRALLVMMTHDKQWFKLAFWKEFFSIVFLKPGLLWRLSIDWLQYFRPNFHPWQRDDRDLLKPKAESF